MRWPSGLTFSRLRYRLLLLVVLAALPALALLFATDWEHQRLSAREAQGYALRLARLAAEHQQRLIEGTRPLLLLLAENSDVQNRHASLCTAFLSRLLGRFPLYTNIGAVTPAGEVFCSARPHRPALDLAARKDLRRALSTRQLTASGYGPDRLTGTPVLTVSWPVTDDGGRVRALVFVELDLGWLEHFVEAARFPEGTAVTVIEDGGRILARHPDGASPAGRSPGDAAIERAIARSGGEGTVEAQGLDGVSRLFAFTPLLGPGPGTRAWVSVGIPAAVAFADSQRLLSRNLVWAGAAFALVVAAALVLGDLVILRHVKAVVGAARRLTAGDLDARARVMSRDEIGVLAGAFNDMAERLAEVVEEERHNGEALAARVRALDLLNELGELLQGCLRLDEAYAALGPLLGRFFPEDTVMLFVHDRPRSLLEAVVSWGDDATGPASVFAPDECWGLRSGRCHAVEDTERGVLCQHLRARVPASCLCAPLVAQGEALGVLHVASRTSLGTPALLASRRRLAEVVAQHLALGVANVRLREDLRNQSIRDPLTGLFNRRYMEETLERELCRAARGKAPIAVLMLDLDRFKEINDGYGHAAGDSLLHELATLLQRGSRREDIACRYGGDEFVLVLPDASLDTALQRAETIRSGVTSLRLPRGDMPPWPLTVSIGVAALPGHGTTAAELLGAADTALYRAKGEGRNRIEVAPAGEPWLLDTSH